jgi:hypothetical protein
MVYYFYLEMDGLKIIILIKNDFNWIVEYVDGDDYLMEYIDIDYIDSNDDIEDIIDILLNDFGFNTVNEIDPDEIYDYL